MAIALYRNATAHLSDFGARLWKQTENLRRRDNLIIGTQLAGFSGIAAAASWFLPYGFGARVALTGLSLGLAKFYGGKEGATAVFFDYFPKAVLLTRSVMKAEPTRNERGIWTGSDENVTWSQFFDRRLARGIANYMQKNECQSAWDFGCGRDDYSKYLLRAGLHASGLDGNPDTPALSGKTAEVQDLSVPFEKEKRDCVISLEVGDQIPPDYADQFFANIANHAVKSIVISWAVPGQKGFSHINPQKNEYVIQKLDQLGWELDDTATRELRDQAHPIYYWFQDSLMVFKKKAAQAE